MMDRLPDDQGYVYEAADELGIETRLVKHDIATRTCHEKAEILGGWPLERIIKTVYFRSGGHVVGVIIPEFGSKIDVESILPSVMPGISQKKARTYVPNFLPSGMVRGTCSPFPYECSMEFEINKLVFYDHPSIDSKTVDISVGGTDEDAMKTSMHIEYDAIYRILAHKFGDKIVKYKLWRYEHGENFSRGL